jgi:putative FmdB family regulatory protein
MPKYSYRCTNCPHSFDARHSIKELLTDCPECDQKEALKRVPSTPFRSTVTKKTQRGKVGEVTKKFIEDTREELKKEKKQLQKEEYKSK